MLNEHGNFSNPVPRTCKRQPMQFPLRLSCGIYDDFGISVAAKLLLLARKQSVDRCVELVAALEEVELEDEDVLDDLATELLDECASSGCGTT